MYYRRASSGFATMVFSATDTVPKTWPAVENSSVLRPLLHRHQRIIASATGNSRDRICCSARSVIKVRCAGSAFSRRMPQPQDGTAHEQRYQLCQCWPRLSCRPGLRRSLSRPSFGSAKSVCIAPQMPFSSASQFPNTSCGSSQLPSFDTFSAFSPMPRPSKTHSLRRAAAA